MATICTNNVPRLLLYRDQLTAKELCDFDYLPDDGSGDFFRYKGNAYDLGEAMRVPDEPGFKDWDGYYGDSYFSGVLVRMDPDDNDRVIVGRYFA